MGKLLVILLCLGLAGCMTIQSYNKLEQSEGKALTASIGSTIFRMDKLSDLPNAFGKADMYGGKVDKGYTELKLKGIKDNGVLTLQITDINKSSSETTMDRYKENEVNISANSAVNIGDASAPDKTVFDFDTKKEKTLTIGGVEVDFFEATLYSVKYTVKKQIN